MASKFFKSLSTRLYLGLLLTTAIVFGGVIYVFYNYTSRSDEQHILHYSDNLLKHLTDKVGHQLDDIEHSLDVTEPFITRNLGDTVRIAGALKYFARNTDYTIGMGLAIVPENNKDWDKPYISYSWINSGDSTGIMRTIGKGYDYQSANWYTETLKMKCNHWSEPYYDEVSSKALVMTFAHPILNNDGNVSAMLFADMSMDEFSDSVNAAKPYPDSYIFIINNEGRFITCSNKESVLNRTLIQESSRIKIFGMADIAQDMLAGKTGKRIIEFNGKKILVTYRPMNVFGWSICCMIPYNTMARDFGSATLLLIGIIVLGMIMLLLCIKILMSRLMRPIDDLTHIADKISSGDLNCDIPEPDSAPDIKLLYAAFSRMQKSITQYIVQQAELVRKEERTASELNIAKEIQNNMIRTDFSAFRDVDVYAKMVPAKTVGGDFYDVMMNDGKLVFSIGDVAGKGVPAAIIMSTVQAAIRTLANSQKSPAHIMSAINNTLISLNNMDMFVVAFIGVLDLSTGKLTFCNAGSTPPIILREDGSGSELKMTTNIPIGILAGFAYKDETVKLPNGASLLFYTDGLSEAENTQKQMLGDAIIMMTARAIANDGIVAENLVTTLFDLAKDFADGAEQSDDTTVLCIATNKCKMAIHPEIEDLEGLPAFIRKLSKMFNIDEHLSKDINIALEEAVSNIILYGFSDSKIEDEILIEAQKEDSGMLKLSITDNGIKFDPTSKYIGNVADTPPEDRSIGGLGIFLMRELTDKIEYSYTNGKNKLNLFFSLNRK